MLKLVNAHLTILNVFVGVKKNLVMI